MKHTLLIIGFCIGVLQAQTIPDLLNEYRNHCNTTALDTVQQMGYVDYELLPVMDGHDVKHYVLGNADTTWLHVQCPIYKMPKEHRMHTMRPVEGVTFDLRPFVNDRPISNDDPPKQKRSIRRQYVCEVKQCRFGGYDDAFWIWVRERY